MKIVAGQTARRTKVFDRATAQAYAELTGDFNPVHFDEEFTKSTIFGKPIIHGPLVLTLVTTLFADELPGPGCVYLSHDVKFLRPVYYDDVITAEVKVIEVNTKNHIFLETTCRNQKNELVLSGLARLKKY